MALVIRAGTRDDLPRLRALFSEGNDSAYDLAAVAEEKCFGDGIAGAPLLRLYETDQKLLGAAVSCGKWLRILVVRRGYRRRGIGSALLADAEARGVSVIAAEPGNYFLPGVPASDESTKNFLSTRGYEPGPTTHNLEVNTLKFEGSLRRPRHENAPRILAFIEQHFGRVWRFEVAKAFERDLPPIFITEEDGEVTGFAAHDVNNRGLGFFGPTGVTASMRGRGLGCRLLEASLEDLRRLGYERAVIPWTDALDFYRKCSGAKPAHRFVAFAKRQP
jgi:mycothiol synthase